MTSKGPAASIYRNLKEQIVIKGTAANEDVMSEPQHDQFIAFHFRNCPIQTVFSEHQAEKTSEIIE
ncbi:hypothetical protein HYALB_00003553 [Hymenoscyphus albidus]|uniref:Uncharacterized protein n=1 Tax=Hymenoscyphus albidus TaxID=595503 RepID=A0A9N9M2L6_9HELO|nr:hypothetical protein HYALB_00003553 [Hymenoscyphus albidus]